MTNLRIGDEVVEEDVVAVFLLHKNLHVELAHHTVGAFEKEITMK